ncbi:hypothetical protein [Alicyclobacillus ferrooxydans]|uniref:Uncharacterized protein n=1 Tax=Alicyclobacillus ferrooxydans TaxID=471514 RepID=A0A0N8PNP0_9BACL|nr:hypothetical protein [Alicyclobacillus ferrooxydans]KPV42061.1 hypothetical protein AN477_20070 [Alicyclobacillus ferrooxydans]
MRDFHLESIKAKEEMENAYLRWSMADPLYEQERWLAYQAAVERYNAIVTEASGRLGAREVVLPWLQSDVSA